MAKKFDKEKYQKDVNLQIPEWQFPDEENEIGQNTDIRGLINAQLININQINLDPKQPRMHFDDEKIAELADSIKKHGLLQPITVTKSNVDGQFTILTGERRFRACKKAERTEIECIILETSDSKDKLAKQLVENLIREDLNAVEKAIGLLEYKKLLGSEATWTQVETELAMSETTRKEHIRLLKLPDSIQSRIVNYDRKQKAGITVSQAKALLLLNSNEGKQMELLSKIMNDPISAQGAMQIARQMKDADLTAYASGERVYKIKDRGYYYSTDEELIEQLESFIEELKQEIEKIRGRLSPPINVSEEDLVDG